MIFYLVSINYRIPFSSLTQKVCRMLLKPPLNSDLFPNSFLSYTMSCICFQGIDILAGVEAIISHLVVKEFQIPCAHAPALFPLPLTSSLSPKSAAEEVCEVLFVLPSCHTHLACSCVISFFLFSFMGLVCELGYIIRMLNIFE